MAITSKVFPSNLLKKYASLKSAMTTLILKSYRPSEIEESSTRGSSLFISQSVILICLFSVSNPSFFNPEIRFFNLCGSFFNSEGITPKNNTSIVV